MGGFTVALVNLKPGTGKTTSAVWLAHVLAEAGTRVVLVDADPSGSALEWSDLAAMYPMRPAPVFPFQLAALPSRALHCLVPDLVQAYEIAIIDVPQLEDHAGIARSAIRCADEIVIPCAPTPIELNRTTPVREAIAEVAALRERPAHARVLLNRCIARANSTGYARQTLADLGYDVLGTTVPRLEIYAQSFGLPIPGHGRAIWRSVAHELTTPGSPTEAPSQWLDAAHPLCMR
jgi:chromosome partitioning protein